MEIGFQRNISLTLSIRIFFSIETLAETVAGSVTNKAAQPDVGKHQHEPEGGSRCRGFRILGRCKMHRNWLGCLREFAGCLVFSCLSSKCLQIRIALLFSIKMPL